MPSASTILTKRQTWSFLWAYASESFNPTTSDTCWKSRCYVGTFEQACVKMERFLSNRCEEVEIDYEARNDTPRHRYNSKNHTRTFPDLRSHPLLREYIR